MSVTVVARLPLTESTRVVVFQFPASLVVVVLGGTYGGFVQNFHFINLHKVTYWSPFVLSFKSILCLK